MTRVLAIANPSGRSGKTSAALGLATMLADLGHAVLAVDLDAQAHLTRGLGVDAEALERSLFDVLVHGIPALDVMTDSDEGVDLVPAALELSGAEAILVTRAGREQVLGHALAPVRDDYDWVVLDCPSSVGLLTVNALSFADLVLVPVREPSGRAMAQLLSAVDEITRFVNPRLRLAGAVAVGHDASIPGLEVAARIPEGALARNAYREFAKRLSA